MDVRILTLFSGIFAFIVVALGAWTRLADAGLGCPDWPGCYGFATIPLSPEDILEANKRFPETPYELGKAIPEVIHRIFAASLGLLIIGICILLTSQKAENKKNILLSYFLLAWVCLQGLLGYLTVSLKLWPQVVTAHLMAGFFTTIMLWVLYFRIKDFELQRQKWNFSSHFLFLLSLGIFLVTLQIFLGAWTSTNYAALSCSDFPLCKGQIMPDSNFLGGFNFAQPIGANFMGGQLDHDSRLAIHLSHRYGALIIFLYLSFVAAVIYKSGYSKISLLLIGLLFFQITLGISNVVFHLPLLVAVGHNIGGLCLITYLSVLRFRE